MEGLNKFKILTIIFIAMFIFVVAAIYSNTKDASATKNLDKEKTKKEQTVKPQNNPNMTALNNPAIEEMYIKLEQLSNRVEEMSAKSNNGSDIRCNIRGIMNDGNIEELSPSSAFQEAQDNNSEIVLTCRFN